MNVEGVIMGIEAEFECIQGQKPAEQPARYNKVKPLPRFVSNLLRFMEDVDMSLVGSMQVAEYTEIRLGMLQRGGMTEFEAHNAIKAERRDEPEAYKGRAFDLFAYGRRLTEGAGAIEWGTFRHALDANPQAVLDDSVRWSAIRNGMQQAVTDWAMTAELE